MYNEIIEELTQKWELWELLGEWNDRIVYASLKNSNNVIKIPKSERGIQQNNFEFRHYLEEDVMAHRLWKEWFPNGLARCCIAPDKKCLYMQRLTVTEWSDFWVIPHNGIIRRFDLNF